jgi:hypothetical protein
MDNYISCIYEKNYDKYFQCIRNYINSKNSFEEALYFIQKNSRREPIAEDEIFHKIYGHAMLGYSSNLPENSYLIVLLKMKNGSREYTTNMRGRRDIYVFDYYSRTQTPESILLWNSKNAKDIKKAVKMVEARVYYFKTKKDIEKLKKDLDNKRVHHFYAPLSLSFPIVLKNQKYFPNILYISKPYTIKYPYVFEIRYKNSSNIKKPIKTYNVDLNCHLLMEFVEDSTIEPYLLGLPYYFELDKNNILNKFDVQIKYDEFIHRFYDSMIKIVELPSDLKFSPEDMGPYQVVIDTNKNIAKPIDIGGGNIIPTSQTGLEKITLEVLNRTTEEVKKSPLLKHCIKKGNYIICNEKIKESELPKILVSDIRKPLENYYNRTDNLDSLLKNIRIDGYRLDEIITQYKDDEFEENREIVLEALKLYLRDHNK